MAGTPDKINVLAELERCGVRYEWAGTDEVKVPCPFHSDDSPSATMNVEKRVFKCHAAGCLEAGDVITYLARLLKVTRQVMTVELSKRYSLSSEKVIDPNVVERYHAVVWKAGPLLKELEKRGVTEEMIRQYRLGEDDGRITIPIKNEGGHYVNVRRYLPGAPGSSKMKNSRGHGGMRMFPVEQLKYSKILLCGGEMKAIVAAAQLNKHGIGAVTTTGGEGNWDHSFNEHFRNKTVWVCLDVDDEGQVAARERCNVLYRFASWVGNVVLPLDRDKYPHGDVNDFVYWEKGELLPLLEGCPGWEPVTRQTDVTEEEPEDVDLSSAMNAKYVGRRVRLKAVVSAMDTAPYVIPKKATVFCSKDQKECSLCPVFSAPDSGFVEVHPESSSIIDMVGSPRSVQREALMRASGIPATCKVVEFEPTEHYNVEDVRVSPQLDITDRSVDRPMQPAMCVGMSMEMNEGYEMVGRMYPHPRTQQTTLMISAYKPVQDALSTYEPRDLDKLLEFRPSAWSPHKISEKLDEIYDDLEANVTRIYQRRDAHLVIDLAYHSPLLLTFDGRTMKGWVEVLVIGDSAQGKSETAINLMNHYKLGIKAECKNASVAGLLGGLQQMGQRWFVAWGVIPTHDKRLVILEEVKGASVEVIAKLTDMRSSGVAELDKIEKKRTHARTRLVMLSNPRSDREMASYNFGVDAVKELIGNPEDVRRFDAALVVSRVDVDASVINTRREQRAVVPHRFTSELCRSLILWSWTRTQDDVVFEDDATDAVMRCSTRLCEKFSDALPLVDRGSMRTKLARLAASIACRTFSTPDDKFDKVLVRTAHVEFVTGWLERVYSAPSFGYADYTAAVRLTQDLVNPDVVREELEKLPWPKDFCKQCLHTTDIHLTDVQDWCAWDRGEAMDLVSFLVRKHAFIRDGRHYRKTPPFIKLLRRCIEDANFVDRPEYLKEPRGKSEF